MKDRQRSTVSDVVEVEVAGQHSDRVIILDDDLFLAARIESVLKKLGYSPSIVTSPAAAVDLVETELAPLVIVNFGRPAVEPIATVKTLKALSRPPTVLGFLSHTHIPAVRAEVREAGCDLLVPNSVITSRLPQLMERLAPPDGGPAKIEEAALLAEDEEPD